MSLHWGLIVYLDFVFCIGCCLLFVFGGLPDLILAVCVVWVWAGGWLNFACLLLSVCMLTCKVQPATSLKHKQRKLQESNQASHQKQTADNNQYKTQNPNIQSTPNAKTLSIHPFIHHPSIHSNTN
jgi:hypothetical protein